MRIDVLTLFPEMFSGYLGQSLLRAAIERGIVDVALHNMRDWTKDRHHTMDDRPFGGGPGMVLQVEPVVECARTTAGDADAVGRERMDSADHSLEGGGRQRCCLA